MKRSEMTAKCNARRAQVQAMRAQGMTLQEIAQELRVTYQRVQQLLKVQDIAKREIVIEEPSQISEV